MGKDRNSYAKTDVDATFMHMKEDHMQNTQLKPGYNMQVGVADEYIVVTDVYQNRNDFGTFVPLLEKFRNFYCRMPINPVADAGYGSFDNYKYCETEKMNKSMKFNLYEQKRSNKYKQDIYNKDNFGISDNNYPVCPAGIEFKYTGTRKGRTKHDDDFYKVYVCPDCTGCNHAKKCKKSDNNRSIHINEKLDEYQKEAIEFLDTQLGKELRCKRSAQAEGAFGIIKGNSEFNRLRRKGMEQVKIEWSLICIGYNLMKFHNKLIR